MRQSMFTGMKSSNSSKGRPWLKRCLYGVLALFLMGIVWSTYVYYQINRAESTVKAEADVGIILGASMWGDHPSPGLRERLEHGLKLYEEGFYNSFIVTGGLDAPGLKYTEAEGMRNYLVEAGVSESDIVLENEATSTYENLLFSKRIMKEHGWSSAIIVTHDYHGTRSLEVAETLGYENPTMALTTSTVLPMAKHKGREILAYTKWTVDRFLITLGWK
ncbi:protein SanA, affects membrane permeability for vancomycin [Paenibacillus uliginis N3/975]|uniref:Protein SanA, affects membrane permeability for vancomycin n=1 Tax=Paenibacillus uliginis N3/975 TaxID=1313296 RepID=A0A1X7HGS6_9BACL|nr:YdcF family protein [Paenibacillus uliginis]SMF86472.1 protein SanA, affects membrane permeability for vancomycin [Paenibacillus uliginis N3/975]